MTNPNATPTEELNGAVRVILKRLRVLAVAVLIMALALLLTTAAVFGSLVNYFAGDALMFGGVTVAAALLGFVFGWFARRVG
ncbi:MAG: hypothetical protein U1E05_17225 [Patescibacteria group bacterium]|nr:hypothetical protein [Patescibacteria group bacterium]